MRERELKKNLYEPTKTPEERENRTSRNICAAPVSGSSAEGFLNELCRLLRDLSNIKGALNRLRKFSAASGRSTLNNQW